MIAPSRSVLAPLIVATHAPTEGNPTMGNVLLAAADAIPRTYAPARYRSAGFMKSYEDDGHMTFRVHTAIGDNAGGYNILAGFYRQPGPKATEAGSSPVEHWCIGLRTFSTDPFGIFDDKVTRVGVLETVRVRFDPDGFEGALELALLRHTWLTTLTNSDPDLSVLGAEDIWHPAWAMPLHQITYPDQS